VKAVLGMLFILVGITTGWLVLSGKLPNAAASGVGTTVANTPVIPGQQGDKNVGRELLSAQPFTISPSAGHKIS